MVYRVTEKQKVEIFSCRHGRVVNSSDCSFCKSRMMSMPKKKIKNYKKKNEGIGWHVDN